MRLSEVPVGQRVRVINVNAPRVIEGRLLGIGFVPGTVVEVVREAPLRDPRVYRVRGKLITLRNSEAFAIEVEPAGRVIPLSMAVVGKVYRVVGLSGGRRFMARMAALGLREGALVKVVRRYPLTLEVDGRYVRIGLGMGDRVIVEEI